MFMQLTLIILFSKYKIGLLELYLPFWEIGFTVYAYWYVAIT